MRQQGMIDRIFQPTEITNLLNFRKYHLFVGIMNGQRCLTSEEFLGDHISSRDLKKNY